LCDYRHRPFFKTFSKTRQAQGHISHTTDRAHGERTVAKSPVAVARPYPPTRDFDDVGRRLRCALREEGLPPPSRCEQGTCCHCRIPRPRGSPTINGTRANFCFWARSDSDFAVAFIATFWSSLRMLHLFSPLLAWVQGLQGLHGRSRAQRLTMRQCGLP
jgi:hypothetical protein